MRDLATPPFERYERASAAALATPVWESVLIIVVAVKLATEITETALDVIGAPAAQVQLLYVLIYGLFAFLLFTAKDAAVTILVATPVLALVIAFPGLSMLWSIDPIETLERAVAVVGTSAFGAYLGWRFTLGRMLFLLAVAMTIAAGLSIIAIVLVPSIGIEQSGDWVGAWAGVHGHKNGLGGASFVACIVIGYAITDSVGRWRVVLCLGFVTALVLLLGSRSTSALIATFVVGALAGWARYLHTKPNQVPVLSVIIALTVVLGGIEFVSADLLERWLGFFGKDATLSSRVPLWTILWTYIEDRFWLGYGFETFWQPGTLRLREIEAKLFFTPFYSHNGLIETWLNGGLVLVVLVASMLGVVLVRSMVIYVRWAGLAISAFPMVYVVCFLIMNFAESVVLARHNVIWSIMVAVAVFVGKWVRLRPA